MKAAVKAARSGRKFTIAVMVPPTTVTLETKDMPAPKGPRELDENGAALDAMVEHAVDGIPSRLHGLDASPADIRRAYGEAYLTVMESLYAGRVGPPPLDPPKPWEALEGGAKRRYLKGAIHDEARKILVRRQAADGTLRLGGKLRDTFAFVEARRRPDGRLPSRPVLLAEWNTTHAAEPYKNTRAMMTAYRRAQRALGAGAFAAARPVADPLVVAEARADLAALEARCKLTDRQRELSHILREGGDYIAAGFTPQERQDVIRRFGRQAKKDRQAG